MKNKVKSLFDTSTTRGKTLRLVFFIIILCAVFVLAYFILKWTNLWQKVNSIDKIRDIVEKGGAFSFVIFMLLQVLQTTILQIPAMFVTVAGAVIFGRWQSFLMSYVAIMIGSLIMFWIGRKAGRPFLYWLVGKESGEKWIKRMSDGKYLFFLMMLFPLFPDDILCVVAGITNMSFPFFFWTNLTSRGIGILCTVYFGSGAIIPFHGWGLIIWGLIFLVVLALFYASVRYKDKIDRFVDKLLKRNKIPPASATEEARDETEIASVAEDKENE